MKRNLFNEWHETYIVFCEIFSLAIKKIAINLVIAYRNSMGVLQMDFWFIKHTKYVTVVFAGLFGRIGRFICINLYKFTLKSLFKKGFVCLNRGFRITSISGQVWFIKIIFATLLFHSYLSNAAVVLNGFDGTKNAAKNKKLII